MGFFDKVLKKAGAFLATRYGVVSAGKFDGCDIALGNPPTENVTTADSFSQMIFFKEQEEVARIDIAEEIKELVFVEMIHFSATNDDCYSCVITFADGEISKFVLYPNRAKGFYKNLKEKMPEETRAFLEKGIAKLTKA